MKKFIYTGALDHNATIRIDNQVKDIRLVHGDSYDLPADHPHIKTLFSTGLLVDFTNNIPNS